MSDVNRFHLVFSLLRIMTIHACSNDKCDLLFLITITIIGFVVLALLVLVLASLIKHLKNKQLNRMFDIPEQQLWSPQPISSVVNYPALSSYFQTDLNDKI